MTNERDEILTLRVLVVALSILTLLLVFDVRNCKAQDVEEVFPHPNGPTIHVKLYDGQERVSLWVLPVPHRTADKAFWITTVISAATTIADMENTRIVLNHGGRELNPLYGPYPGRVRQYAISSGLFALATYVSYKAKRKQDAEIAFGVRPEYPKWIVSQLANIGTHAFGIAFTIGNTGQ
jgi:hypothetical protein